ncbi:MAG: histidinol dehydrogenase [Gemmatimonadaceae bacterium]
MKTTDNERKIKFTRGVSSLTNVEKDFLFHRSTSSDDEVRRTTSEIIKDVIKRGDLALLHLATRLDRVSLSAIEVPREACRVALGLLDVGLRRAMERSVRNIETVQLAAMPVAHETESEPGIVIGRRPDPLDRVGVYAPGGRATYPSSVLMGAVPARVAGVREVVLCSPPGPDGLPSAAVLAAAELAGVDRVFALGGAGAVAAMAYGTETVPRVDRIVGPGNAYVAEAKLQVAGVVAIDSPAGPSELLVIADASADPSVIANEVMAQAEHDPRAVVVTVAVGDGGVADRLLEAIMIAVPAQSRRDIVAESLSSRGAVLEAADMDEAVAFANAFAPEHLLLATADARAVLPRLRNAGTIFVGETSSVAFGDYMTGANHVLPTGGLARSYSGLSVLDFIRWTTYQIIDADAARRLAGDVATFADAEGLSAHAASARKWSVSGAGN